MSLKSVSQCATAVVAAGIAWSRFEFRRKRFAVHVREVKNSNDPCKWGMQLFSQHSEDGITAVLVERLGLKGGFVEFGFGSLQNNSLAICLAYGMPGLFLDGSEHRCLITNRMMSILGRKDVVAKSTWIDRDNVDRLVASGPCGTGVDILSIDVDGVDYWLWEAITSIKPKVVIIEYNASFGPARSVTVAYDRAYDRMTRTSPLMHGMSILAAEKLGRRKGYILIGCNEEGGNAFFVRDDVVGDLVHQAAGNAFRPLQSRLMLHSQDEQESIAFADSLVEI